MTTDQLRGALWAFDAVGEAIFVLDHNLHIVFVNRACCDLAGRSKVDLEGKTFRALELVAEGTEHLSLLLERLQSSPDFVASESETLPVVLRRGGQRSSLTAQRLPDWPGLNHAILVSVGRPSDGFAGSVTAEVALAEIQHRIFNSLQLLLSAVHVKLRQTGSQEARHHLEDIQRRIMGMSTVYRRLDLSPCAELVSIKPYLEELVEALDRGVNDQRIALQLHISGSGVFPHHKAVGIGMMVTELVVNALKHGFAGRHEGTISIAFETRASAWHLTVADDGNGKGIEPERVGLGTRILESCAAALHARMERTNRAGDGTIVRLSHGALSQPPAEQRTVETLSAALAAVKAEHEGGTAARTAHRGRHERLIGFLGPALDTPHSRSHPDDAWPARTTAPHRRLENGAMNDSCEEYLPTP